MKAITSYRFLDTPPPSSREEAPVRDSSIQQPHTAFSPLRLITKFFKQLFWGRKVEKTQISEVPRAPQVPKPRETTAQGAALIAAKQAFDELHPIQEYLGTKPRELAWRCVEMIVRAHFHHPEWPIRVKGVELTQEEILANVLPSKDALCREIWNVSFENGHEDARWRRAYRFMGILGIASTTGIVDRGMKIERYIIAEVFGLDLNLDPHKD
jgi:hypothetical protein